MITYTQVQCDVCGQTQGVPEGRSYTELPTGWLFGTVNLSDVRGKEGQLHGHMCATCSALPIRDLICKWKARGAAREARLA